jgi:hypothetical protein
MAALLKSTQKSWVVSHRATSLTKSVPVIEAFHSQIPNAEKLEI